MTISELISARLAKLREAMRLDALLFASGINSRYITDFDFSDGYVLVTPGEAYLFADFRYIEAAKKAATDDFRVVMIEGGLAKQLSPILADANVTTLGYEDRALTCARLEQLKRDFPMMQFEPMGRLADDLRECKDEVELSRIESAQRIAEQALEQLLGIITPEMTEREVALELEYRMRKLVSEGVAFDTIAVSGSASALPHGVPRDVKLERGFLTLDFGAVVGGYRSDMTRTIAIGSVTDEMKKVYDTVLSAQLAALEAIGPGKTGAEIDKIAREIIDGAGYRGCFGHGLGHGVGLEIHESPRVSSAGTNPLVPGNVVTVEPGIYLEGRFGVRIEDMVVIREDGVQNLTRAPKELLVI
jgi:Xaa-Pro aminopeptidase